MPGARKPVQQGMNALEMSLRGLPRNFGLKVGPTSRGRFHIRSRDLVEGNTMLRAWNGRFASLPGTILAAAC